jgi:hypothetical protein
VTLLLHCCYTVFTLLSHCRGGECECGMHEHTVLHVHTRLPHKHTLTP